jgi:hypothetical protein
MAEVLGERVEVAMLVERVEDNRWIGIARSAGVDIISGAEIEADVRALIENRLG